MNRYAVCTLSIMCIVAGAFSGAIWTYENGTPQTGTASAGYATNSSNDASAAFGNPAAMALLDRTQILVGGLANFITTEFKVDSATFTGGNGGPAGIVLPAGGLYYVHNLSAPFKLGFALNSYADGSVDYKNSWSGRYYTQHSLLLTFNANPVASYRLLPWLSVGAGISLGFARINQQAAINNMLDSLPDGTIRASGNQLALGGNGGVLIETVKKIRIGMTYRSPHTFTFSKIIELENVGPTLATQLSSAGISGSSSKIKVSIPQEVAIGVYIPVVDKVAVMVDANWQNWSSFGSLDLQIPSTPVTTLTVKQNLNDTWHIATGVHYHMNEPLLLTLGFAYDSSPSIQGSRSTSLPVDRQLRYAGGFQYDLQKKLIIGLAYEFIDLGTSPIDLSRGSLSGVLKGKYDTNSNQLASMTLAWLF